MFHPRRGCLVIFVYLKITTLFGLGLGLEYDYRTFDVQPHPILFWSQPDDHYTVPRADVTFACSVTSFNGLPNILWFFNNTVIKTGSHYNISNDGHTTSTLIIRNVSTDDHGDYHCCINDWNTRIRSRPGRLYVMDDGNMSEYDDVDIWNYNINAVYRSTVVLPCHLEMSTKPIWLQNQEFNQTLFIDESGNLVLVNVSEDHSGHYQCQVNESGTIRNGSSYELTVHSLMGSLDHDHVESGISSSQYLRIIPDHCEQSPQNQTVTLQCPVTGHPSPTISWYLNGELVNLTDYNVTDNVGNNSWIIEGGDPCRLIGYWQCFATNEAGTVHNEIRVFPYGWMNPPGRPTLKVANLSEDLTNDLISVNVNITWSSPQYLGSLNASDIYYQLHATGYDIITTETYYVLFYDELNLSIDKKALDVSIAVHYNGSTTDTLYIPTNIIEKKRYDNLLCDAVDFKPPQIFKQYFDNGTYLVRWSLLTDQELSFDYLEDSQQGWLLSGNCTENGIVMIESVLKDLTYTRDYASVPVSEGMSCTYEIRPDYDGCDCGISCQSSFTCTYVNGIVSPTTMAISPATTISLEMNDTVTETSITTTFVTMKSKSTSSMITLTTPSTSNDSVTMVPAVTSSPTSSSGDTSSATLFITIAVLISLLIASVIIFCTVLCIYRWKSTGKYADIRFLKMSQTVKMMKPPLSNNYCSTINIADESVCEMPVNKVKRWIDDNDFKQNGDLLRSESFQSIATSQMFAYIRKDDKNEQELLVDYIDDIQLDKHLQSVCNNTSNEVNKINPEAQSTENNGCEFNPYCDENTVFKDANPYYDEDAIFNNVNPYYDEESNVFDIVNPYCEENNVFNNSSHLNHSQTSLPGYMDETNGSEDDKKSQKSLSSVSLDSITLSQHCPRIFDKLHILKDGHTNSLPDLSPYVSNPIFSRSFDFLQSPCNETTDSIQMPTRSYNHSLKQPRETNVDSWLSVGSSSDSDCESNPGSIEALQSSGYYKPVSSKNEEIDSQNNSTVDLSHSSNLSLNASTSGIQSSGMGYFELSTEETRCTYFSSRTKSDIDFSIDSQLCDIAASSDTDNCFTGDTPNVDSGYVHLPLSTENDIHNQPKDISQKSVGNLSMNHYVLSTENI